jgi:hypothetical protein
MFCLEQPGGLPLNSLILLLLIDSAVHADRHNFLNFENRFYLQEEAVTATLICLSSD